MDCIISNDGVRTFCSSLGCLAKIGKDIYFDFDPMDGITLRSLNDAKSAFASFQYQPSFFERCTALTQTHSVAQQQRRRRRLRRKKRRRRRFEKEKRRTRRKSNISSEDHEEEDNDDDDEEGHHDNNEDDHDDNDDDERFSCRVPVRALAAVVRPRKNVVALRITTIGVLVDDDDNISCASSIVTTSTGGVSSASTATRATNASSPTTRLCLSFEFHILSGGGVDKRYKQYNSANAASAFFSESSYKKLPSTMIRVTHRVGVADADSVAAVAPKENCSEIIASPKVLLQMIEPLKRTEEMAFIARKDSDSVMVTSFHHGDTILSSSASNNNSCNQNPVVLQNSLNNQSQHLKTEATIACDEFDEFDFIDDRPIDQQQERQQEDMMIPTNIPPLNVNDEVVLVFSIKEARAMLQFCSQQSSSNAFLLEQGLQVSFSFHWGGKPVILETTNGNETSFSATLILSTLDHKLLKTRTRNNHPQP